MTQTLSLYQAEVAVDCGADGVFLISHNGNNMSLLPVARKIKHKYPQIKVGINLLGHDVMDTIDLGMEYFLDMVWFDDCGVTSRGLDSVGQQVRLWKEAHSNEVDLSFDIFASVAFKYQEPEPNPDLAASIALDSGFIPTTSGSGTGSPPELSKIISMSHHSKGQLAVASGMTPDNVAEFAPYLSHILVSTGVSSDFHRVNSQLLKKFVDIAKNN